MNITLKLAPTHGALDRLRVLTKVLLNKDGGAAVGRKLGPRLAHTALWSVVGAAAARSAGLIAATLVARVLGSVEFGKFGMIQSTVGLFGTFAGCGLGMMVSKYVAEYRTDDPNRAGRIITLSELFSLISGSVMAVSLFLCAPWLAERTLANAAMAQPVRISAALLLLNALIGAQTGALSGIEAFRDVATINLISGLVTAALAVGGAYAGGLTGALVGAILSLVVNCFLNYTTLIRCLKRHGIPFPARGALRECKVLWTFSFPATLAGAMVGPATWVSNALLIHTPNGYAELGLVSAANQWRTAIAFFPATIGTAFLPILSSLYAGRDLQAFRKVARLMAVSTLAVVSVVALPVLVFPEIVMKTYGQSFSGGSSVLSITVVAAVILAVNNQLSRVLASAGRMWTSLLMDAAWALSFVIASVCLIPNHRAIGLAYAVLFSAGLQSVFQCCYLATWRKKGIPDCHSAHAVQDVAVDLAR